MLLSGRILTVFVLLFDGISNVALASDMEDGMSDEEWDSDDDDDDDGLEACVGDEVERCGVVVVGCGLAGLYATARLQREGIEALVLESDEICGGRLRSWDLEYDDNSKLHVEKGANFMYGTKRGNSARENPIHRLFQGYDLDFANYDDRDFSLFEADGTAVDQSEALDALDTLIRSKERCLDNSGDEWFDEYFEDVEQYSPDANGKRLLRNCGRRNSWRPNTPEKEALAHFVLEQEHGKQLKELGRGSWSEDWDDDFGSDLFFPNDSDGSSSMIETWVNDHIKPNTLRLQHTVTRVRYEREKNAKTVVSVKQPNGELCKKKFRSKYVIVTPSMTVLRNHIKFRPPLDLDEHPIYINTMEKVWVKFSRKFWGDEQFFLIANKQQNGAGTLWFNMDAFYPDSRTLLGFVREDQLEALGGAPLTRAAVSQWMSGLMNLEGWGDDIDWTFHATDWKGDPKFGGSWEYWLIGLNYGHYFENIQPRGKLHLAGAAHCNRYWGFTWAAILSGLWNAEWVSLKFWTGNEKIEAPYTPCDDPGNAVPPRWRDLYEDNPFFSPPPPP